MTTLTIKTQKKAPAMMTKARIKGTINTHTKTIMTKKITHSFFPMYVVLQCITLLAILSSRSGVFVDAATPDEGLLQWRGVDVSFLPSVENKGGVFFNQQSQQVSFIKILTENCINLARINIWVDPPPDGEGCCSLPQALELSKRLNAVDIGILMNFHFSDTWSDPSQQTKPKAWEHLEFNELRQTLRNYTRDSLLAFYEQDIRPVAVQLGNEIAGGILWPDGRNFNEYDNDGNLISEYDTPHQWNKLGQLLRSARAGLWDASKPWQPPLVVIHNEHGANFAATQWFFDRLFPEFDNFNIIGLSFYPWWHGTFDGLQENLEQLRLNYGKQIAIVEAGYPWILDSSLQNDNNFVQEQEQLHHGYPPTIKGQERFILNLKNIVREATDVLGVVYWAPGWITGESAWENAALFDENGHVLPGLAALGSCHHGGLLDGDNVTQDEEPSSGAVGNVVSLTKVMVLALIGAGMPLM